MHTDKEDILRKIKHCLALSKSSNETEAATANYISTRYDAKTQYQYKRY